MKIKYLALLLFTLAFITVFSCSSKSKRSRKPVSSIKISPVSKNYIYGQKIDIKVNTKVKNGSIDRIQLYVNNELVCTEKTTEFSFRVDSLKKLGQLSLKVSAIKTDGKTGINSKFINVLSDIVPEKYGYELINTYPHSTKNFTEGLLFHDGSLYESTGEKDKSFIYKTDYRNGTVLKSIKLEPAYFGEGMCILNNKIYQLTYRSQKGFVYDLNSMERIDTFTYVSKEGWGLTTDGKHLIMSNGSDKITYINPDTYKTEKILNVADNKGPVKLLNELEMIKGFLYANIWSGSSNIIVKIDPETGKVLSIINLKNIFGIQKVNASDIDAMNGIAYDSTRDKILVTGKWWPSIFEVKFIKSE